MLGYHKARQSWDKYSKKQQKGREASDIQGRLSRSSSQAPARAKALERALRMVY